MAPSRKRKSKKKLDPNVPKWKFLEHHGPMFPIPSTEKLPSNVKLRYAGKIVELSEKAEEMAILYGQILDPETTKSVIFKRNFFDDWCLQMTDKERELITNMEKCDFEAIEAWCRQRRTQTRRLPKEARMYPKPDAEVAVYLKEKAVRDALLEKHGFATVDEARVLVMSFEIPPTKLFLGNADSPKLGMLRKPIEPEDIIINCSADSKIPEPPAGHNWKEVRHDRTKLWLAYWKDPIADRDKYMMLEPDYKPQTYPLDLVEKLKSEDNECDNSSEAQSDDVSENNHSTIQESPSVGASDDLAEEEDENDSSSIPPSLHDSAKRAKISTLPPGVDQELTASENVVAVAGNGKASPTPIANGSPVDLDG